MSGKLTKADERLASHLAAVGATKRRERRYRCDTCGLLYPAEELTPDFDQDGRRVGWTCENCY